MKITFLGHSCFEIETAGKTLLFDPFISGNTLASHINIDALQPDYILLSHGHGDHVLDAESIARRTGAPIISNYEIVTWYKGKGLNGHEMNHGGSWSFDFGKVKYVNAVHSSVLPDGTYGGNPGGFVIENEEGRFYFAGDTALHMDMKLIPLTCGKLNFAILPIGSNFTMDVSDAVLASQFIECDEVIGCHFDTFGYIKIDHQEALHSFSKAGKRLRLLGIGESIMK
jgi:L-ascorbate metabolism protein UlaG (beta-lactamase superfamily)